MNVSIMSSPDVVAASTLLPTVLLEGGLSTDDFIKFQIAVSAHVLSPATREFLHEEIKKLSAAVVSIENNFATISVQMIQFEEKGIPLDQEDRPTEYAPKWEVLHDEYTHLTMESQRTANKVSAKINELLHVVLPVIEDLSISIDDKQELLDEYINGLNGLETEGNDKAGRFLRLRDNVDNFRKNLVMSQSPEVREKIQELDEKIAQIQADLESSSKFLTACWDVLKLASPGMTKDATCMLSTLGAAGAISGTLGLAVILPHVGIAILIAGFIALGVALASAVQKRANQRQVQIADLLALQHERDRTALKFYELSEVLDPLHNLDMHFSQTINSLHTIQGISGMLNTDCQRLRNVLASLKTTTNKTMFRVAVHNLKGVYKTLQLALEQYCLAVAK